MTRSPMWLPPRLEVVVEVPRGGVVKRRQDGSIDFISPLPSPFNYGSVPDTEAPDGDPYDAIVLGPRLASGRQVERPVLAVFGFLDRGRLDPKIVCGSVPLRAAQRRSVERFFAIYVQLKRGLQRWRRQSEPTEVLGWLPWSSRRP